MKVDMGSKEQDFIWDDITILRTSSCEHDRKDVNDDLALLMIGISSVNKEPLTPRRLEIRVKYD